MDKTAAITFRSLAQALGISIADPLPQDWPLEQWFASIIDTPLAAFTVFDFAWACRQRTFHEYIVPYALAVLRENPLAGELYDGELLSALLGLPQEYWDSHRHEMGLLRSILPMAFVQADDTRLQAEIERFRRECV